MKKGFLATAGIALVTITVEVMATIAKSEAYDIYKERYEKAVKEGRFFNDNIFDYCYRPNNFIEEKVNIIKKEAIASDWSSQKRIGAQKIADIMKNETDDSIKQYCVRALYDIYNSCTWSSDKMMIMNLIEP